LTCINGANPPLRTLRVELPFLLFFSRGAAREGRIGYAAAHPVAFCGRRIFLSACRLS
jgi:hypothetical protein